MKAETRLNISYEPFSREPEYIDLNRAFIRSLDLKGTRRLVDLAGGTGTLSALFLDEVGGQALSAGEEVRIICLDISPTSLELGQKDLKAYCDSGTISFIEGSAEHMPLPDGWADTILLGNAIHYFEDQERLLAEVRRVLRRGGLFAFNSSFYAGTFPPGTERFYTEWLKEALGMLKRMDQQARRKGKPPITRVRGTGKTAFSQAWLSAGEYLSILEKADFSTKNINERRINMSRRNFETVGAYQGLAAVLLSGFPVSFAAEALMRAVEPALKTVGMERVPRNWLEVTAYRQ